MTGILRGGVLALALTAIALPALAANDGGLRRPGSGPGDEVAVGGFFAAEVAADGTLVSGAGVENAQRLLEGIYEVRFRKRNLHRACWWTASIADRNDGEVPAAMIGIDARSGTNNGLYIQVFDPDGAYVDAPFIVVAVCR